MIGRMKAPFPPALFVLIVLLALVPGCTGVRSTARGGLPVQPAPDPAGSDGSGPRRGTQAQQQEGARATSAADSEVDRTIREARALFRRGMSHYSRDEMSEARSYFDRAVERIASHPGGAKRDPLLAEAYAELIRDIHDVESASYQLGPGLSPREPAPIEVLDDFEPEITPEQAARDRELIGRVDLPSEPAIVFNDRVLAWIDIYRGTLRERFQEGLRRSGRYLEMFKRILREEGLPEDLAYLAHVESAYKPHAYSRAGAKGLWQFIAGTGARYGLRRNWYIDERSDPELSTRAAAAYLKDLYAWFGDWYLAMAGYNAGEGKIKRAIERTGHRDFWDIAKTPHIMLETKNYVPAILAAIVISKNPEKFGFDAEKDPPFVYDSVPVSGPTDLRVAAELAGSTVEELRFLNPALARLMTPPNYPDFPLRVPRGTGERFAAAYAELPVTARVPWKSHSVRRGETLSAISRRYGVSVAQIRQANGLSPGEPLRAGSSLQIPTYIPAASGGHGDLTRSASLTRPVSRGRTIHTVRRGDTLSSIARRYGTSVANLRLWNGLGQRSMIKPGDRLIVSGSRTQRRGSAERSAGSMSRSEGAARAAVGSQARSASPANKAAVSTYRVKRGDTLYKIALRLSTTVENLCRWNKISANDTLLPGTILRIER